MKRMKSLKTVALGAGLLIGSISFAQKSNVVNAAMEYKDFPKAMAKQEFAEAKKVILEAKGYIDLAMKHEDTKDDAKTHYYNGIIYTGLLQVSSLPGNDDMKQYQNEGTKESIKNSLKFAYEAPKSKYKRDVKDFVENQKLSAGTIGSSAFENKQYYQAFQAFASGYEISGIIGEKDEGYKTNASASAVRAFDTLVKQEKFDEGFKVIDEALEIDPTNVGLATTAVDVALKQDNLELANKYFDQAAKSAPDNKELFGSMGGIFLGKGEIKRAEELLIRAVEIDSNYDAANYNLGVLYLEEGTKLQKKAADMRFDDPNLEKVEKEKEETFAKAIAPLERYLANNKNDVNVVKVLMQVSRQAGQNEKALAYKKRFDELRAQ